MKKELTYILILALSFTSAEAVPANDIDKTKRVEESVSALQRKQVETNKLLLKLTNKQKVIEQELQSLGNEAEKQSTILDSLRNECKRLEAAQYADRKDINGKIFVTDNNIRANQTMLQNHTFWGIGIAIAIILLTIFVILWLFKRIKNGASSIDNVRKAQEALQAAQTKMQEESIKLDDKLLELFDRQIANAPKNAGNDKPDHSLALKVADEIVRIELNMSRMDTSIKGYKQLAKAVERIKDNFRANGYEIVDLLGKPYNEGMKVIANFVVDEDLEEGKQIITGITKPQINYNGQMIQAAQITVSQNI